jgi:hypothetical protein
MGGDKMNANKLIKIAIVAGIISMVPFIATAKEMISGKIVGFTSLIHPVEAPVNNKDPRIKLENDFVLLLPNGEYYLLENVSRNFKIKYFKKAVRVEGKVNDEYRSITVSKLQVEKKGKGFRTVYPHRKPERSGRYNSQSGRFGEKGNQYK